MSCALTQGYTLDCRDNKGGVKAVYILELSNVLTVTASSGIVSAITIQAGTNFWGYQLEKETAKFTEKPTTSDENGTLYYEQDLEFPIRKLSSNWRNETKLLAQNRLAMIVQDRNGNYWLAGVNATTYNGAAAIVGIGSGFELQTSENDMGQKFGDMNGYKLKFKAKMEEPMLQVPSTLITNSLVNSVILS